MKRINILSLFVLLFALPACLKAAYIKPSVIAERLLAQGPEARAVDGGTALHFAAISDDVALIDRVLEHIFRVDVRNDAGYTPFHWAVATGSRVGAEYLFERAKVDVNQPAFDGLRPLDAAIISGSTDMVKFLLERGASPDCDKEISCLTEQGYAKNRVTSRMRAARAGIELAMTPSPDSFDEID